jgi:hypothetical protein
MIDACELVYMYTTMSDRNSSLASSRCVEPTEDKTNVSKENMSKGALVCITAQYRHEAFNHSATFEVCRIVWWPHCSRTCMLWTHGLAFDGALGPGCSGGMVASWVVLTAAATPFVGTFDENYSGSHAMSDGGEEPN